MVIKISKFLAYAMFFILFLIYFTPKVAIYYLVEKELKPLSVIITDEKVIDNGFSLTLKDAVVTVKGIPSAKISYANAKQFVVYNSFYLEDIKLSAAADSMVPTDVKHVSIVYSIFNPLNVTLEAEGGFGQASGVLNILDMALHVDLVPSKKMLSSHRSTLRNLKKSKEGVYIYDKIIKL